MTIIDSAVLWPNRKVYFFSGSQYYRYDVGTESVDPGYPLPIAGNWGGLAAPLYGAVVWPNGKAYFFTSNGKYYSYDIASDQVDVGSPFPTGPNWRGILGGPQGDYQIGAAVTWPNGKAYLFQYGNYYSYDIAGQQVDGGYPKPIQDNWPGLAITGQAFTAAFIWPKVVAGSQKAYFFHSAVYLRYDVNNDAVDPGYPQPIQGNWLP